MGKTESVKKFIFTFSIVLNVILIVTIVTGIKFTRNTAFNVLADCTIAEVRLQELFVKELDSADPKRIEAVKDLMRRNIKNGKNSAITWAEASK